MKNFIFYTILAAFLALPVVAVAADDHAVDCSKAENADKAECQKHDSH